MFSLKNNNCSFLIILLNHFCETILVVNAICVCIFVKSHTNLKQPFTSNFSKSAKF